MTSITAFTTGTARVKHALLRGRGPGPMRQVRLLTPGTFSEPMPIHVWLVEHQDGLLLVDTGSMADAPPTPVAQFAVTPADHIDVQLRAAGVDLSALTVILTHVHGDHADGLAVLPGASPLIAERELRAVRRFDAVAQRRVLRQPLPAPFEPTPFALDDGPVGAFEASHRLTPDGRIRAVATPGHTAGHVSILIDEGDHDVLIAGDASYSDDHLRARYPDGASPSAATALRTMDRILAHARQRPTVYLPSHDPNSASRLTERTVLQA